MSRSRSNIRPQKHMTKPLVSRNIFANLVIGAGKSVHKHQAWAMNANVVMAMRRKVLTRVPGARRLERPSLEPKSHPRSLSVVLSTPGGDVTETGRCCAKCVLHLDFARENFFHQVKYHKKYRKSHH